MVKRRAALVTATGWLMAAGATASGQIGSTEADQPERFDIGRAATPAEIEAWDIDVMPDGEGLPVGRGTAIEGRAIYEAQCQSCHGPGGKGGPFDRLVGRLNGDPFPFGLDPSYHFWRVNP